MIQTVDDAFFPCNRDACAKNLGKVNLKKMLQNMLNIRNFELRAENAYQQGNIGGFLHLYIGQEAIQTSLIEALGINHWFVASYRCHALALLLGETPSSLMKELFGKKGGNAEGRGGSMHLYSKRMLGGFGIVGGQISIATGAAFTCKYLEKKEEIAVSFFGDGAVAQGAFHESLNLASLYSLPCLYVIENNKWSMGTPLFRTIANYKNFARKAAESYDIRYLKLDGMDIFSCYSGFQEAYSHISSTGRPILVECMTDRFRGHSISDPAHYRSKEELKKSMERDPLTLLKSFLISCEWLTEDEYKEMDAESRKIMIQAVKDSEEAEWPDPATLETDVLAPFLI